MMGFIEKLRQEREELVRKMERNYQRGDAEELLQHDMCISIFENLHNAQTDAEKDKVFLDHGWTLTKADGTVLRPEGSVRVEDAE